jgi:acetate---CoA ligase (ADP-forming) subunit beta
VTDTHQMIAEALAKGETALSEADGKLLLASYDITVTREVLAFSRDEAIAAASSLGFPVALKGCHWSLQHKSDLDLLRLDIRDRQCVAQAFDELAPRVPAGGGILVQEMVEGKRELLLGLVRDPQFGPCVSLATGGIFAEVLQDVTFRVVPFTERDADAMIDELAGAGILKAWRGLPEIDRDALVRALMGLARIGLQHSSVHEIDVNPVIIAGQAPVAVDALVLLRSPAAG